MIVIRAASYGCTKWIQRKDSQRTMRKQIWGSTTSTYLALTASITEPFSTVPKVAFHCRSKCDAVRIHSWKVVTVGLDPQKTVTTSIMQSPFQNLYFGHTKSDKAKFMIKRADRIIGNGRPTWTDNEGGDDRTVRLKGTHVEAQSGVLGGAKTEDRVSPGDDHHVEPGSPTGTSRLYRRSPP